MGIQSSLRDLNHLFGFTPALKRWAIFSCPSGAGASLSCSADRARLVFRFQRSAARPGLVFCFHIRVPSGLEPRFHD